MQRINGPRVGNSQKTETRHRSTEEKTTNSKGEKTMRKSHLIVLSVILIAAISSTAMAADSQPVAGAPAVTGIVNLNTADAAQLEMLPRVGAKAAQRILDYRKEHGNFKKTSDLMQVKGFGEKSFERLAAYVSVDGKTTLSSKVHTTRARKPSAKKPSPAA
jgi:competence protein ComEA